MSAGESRPRSSLDEGPTETLRRHSLAEIARWTGIPATGLRGWVRARLLVPSETAHGVPLFDFAQVAAARRIDELVRSGLDVRRLARSLRRLRRWYPEAEPAIARLESLSRGEAIRDAEGRLFDVRGQSLFDFDEVDSEEEPESSVASMPFAGGCPRIDAEFDEATRLEEAGRLDEAESAYRDWLAKYGPDPDAVFNLANVLRQQGRNDAAIERYRQAIEIDPDYAEAWLNLGAALAETGRCEEAAAATRRAVELDPHDLGGLYNLADTLDEAGCSADAAECWREYLRYDADSEFADHARRRLAEIAS